MSAKKAKHTDAYLVAARQDERREQSRDVIYSVAGRIAVTLLTRIKAAEVTDDEAIEALAEKVVTEASIMAMSIWDCIDDHIENAPPGEL